MKAAKITQIANVKKKKQAIIWEHITTESLEHSSPLHMPPHPSKRTEDTRQKPRGDLGREGAGKVPGKERKDLSPDPELGQRQVRIDGRVQDLLDIGGVGSQYSYHTWSVVLSGEA